MARTDIIGRTSEIAILEAALSSARSEFVAIYGRRRVGKTFLIRALFEEQFAFQVIGMANANMANQLLNFHSAMQAADRTLQDAPVPKSWLLAFMQLSRSLEQSTAAKKVVFIDELPWFDTPNSSFVSALEHFWNSWASARKDVLLVVCGSAASWILSKLINNKGGLHNRLTKRIKINPFTLQECEALMRKRNADYTRYQLAELYMVMGGIPYYWDEVDVSLSTAQNIEAICFAEGAPLRTEFGNLFSSLFSQSERHEAIVEAIAGKAMGLSRSDIITATGMPNSGRTSKLLNELEANGFIRQYAPFGRKTRTSLYQLVDFYTLFYIRYIRPSNAMDENLWINAIDDPARRAWSGYAFEQVCLAHLPQIKRTLGITAIQTSTSSWRSIAEGSRVQIDLVIDRRDQTINLVEIKFALDTYIIDKVYYETLRNKVAIFKNETKTRKAVSICMVTTFGLARNQYAQELVRNEMSLEQLFGA
jgi:uncharacterized protein